MDNSRRSQILVNGIQAIRPGLAWWLRSEASLASLAHTALEVCFNFLPIVYPLLIATLGLRYGQIGTIVLVGSLCGTLTQPIFGYLSDRWGPRRIVIISVAWIGISMGLLGFADRFGIFTVLVGLGALGSAAFHPAGASIAASEAGSRRGIAMSFFSVGGNIGSAISPLFVGVAILWFGLSGTAVMIPFALLVSLFLYFKLRDHPLEDRLRPPAPKGPVPEGARPGSKTALALVVLIVASRSWFQGSLITFMPEWLQGNGSSPEAAGSTLALLLAAVGMGSLTGGTLSDRWGRLPVIIASLVLLGPALWGFLTLAGLAQVIAAGVIGLMIGASFPVAILMAQDAFPEGIGLASALVMGLGWLPAGLGSWVLGELADSVSLSYALHTLIYVPIIGIGAAALFARQTKMGRSLLPSGVDRPR